MAVEDLRHSCNLLKILGIRTCFNHGGELGLIDSDTNVKVHEVMEILNRSLQGDLGIH